MKRTVAVLVLLLLAVPAFAAQRGRYIVLTRTPAREARAEVLRETGSAAQHDVRIFENVDAFAANLSDEDIATLRASRVVRGVHPVVERHISDVGAPMPARRAAPDSSYDTAQVVPYGVDLVRAREVWRVTRGGNINLAVLDTGLDVNHPDLKNVAAGTYSTFANTADVPDENRHGTHVAGTIAALDNSIGVVGIAPGVRLWCVKVLDKNGSGDDEHILAGMDWVIAKKHEIGGNWIVSISFGSEIGSIAESEMVQKLIAEGILVVAAAGNRALPGSDFPAAYPGVMAIGAVGSDAQLADFSNYGHLSVVAPGVRVLSTVPVGSMPVAEVQTRGGEILNAWALRGSPRTDLTGEYVYCQLGRAGEFPAAVSGNIALIQRGEIPFNEKVKNAKAAGAGAVVVFNSQDGAQNMNVWTLILQDCDVSGCRDNADDLNFAWPLTLGLTYADGEKLLEAGSDRQTLGMSYRMEDYARYDGTSMATPHVSAAAALVWSVAPRLSASDLLRAIEMSARDLGDTGYDANYGWGLVDAFAAARLVAPSLFPVTPPTPGRHRAARR